MGSSPSAGPSTLASTPISSLSPTPLGLDRSRTSPSMMRRATKSQMVIVADLVTPEIRFPMHLSRTFSEEAGVRWEGIGRRDNGVGDGVDIGSGGRAADSRVDSGLAE